MLRAMSELEKAIDKLLDRLQRGPCSVLEKEDVAGLGDDEDPKAREREAAQWIRRALERLKAL